VEDEYRIECLLTFEFAVHSNDQPMFIQVLASNRTLKTILFALNFT
jgi:hypothetical protein